MAKTNNGIVFLVFLIIMFIITYLQQEFVLLPELHSLDIVGDDTKIELIRRFQQMRWLAFLLGPLLLLLRLVLVTLCLFIAGFFFNEMEGNTFGNWWGVALKAQIVMVAYSVFLCVANLVLAPDTVVKISTYSSLLFLCNGDTEAWVRLPLAAINFVEVLYWTALTFFVGKLCNTTFGKSFRFVLSSYGVGYLFYLSLLIFLLLYLT